MTKRKPTQDFETEILLQSKRRCCLCAALEFDFDEKRGQIAHIDRNPENNRFDNLVWLCLDHHSVYDSTTSQHKNYKPKELKAHRDWMYGVLSPEGAPVTLERDDPTLPFCLAFDGINDTIYYSGEDLLNLYEYCVEGKFRLADTRYSGSFLSINGANNQPLVRLRYYSYDHEEYPGHIALHIYNPSEEKLDVYSAIRIDTRVWQEFKLSVSKSKITCQINKVKNIAMGYERLGKVTLIQIGASGIGAIGAGHMDPLACYFSYFKIYDLAADLIICHYIFDYGIEYLKGLPKSDQLHFHGGMFSKRQFVAIPIDIE